MVGWDKAVVREVSCVRTAAWLCFQPLKVTPSLVASLMGSVRRADAANTNPGQAAVARKMPHGGTVETATIPSRLPTSPPTASEPQQRDCSASSPSVTLLDTPPLLSPLESAFALAFRAQSPQRSATMASTITSESAVLKFERVRSIVIYRSDNSSSSSFSLVSIPPVPTPTPSYVANASAIQAPTPKNAATTRYGFRCRPWIGKLSDTSPYNGFKLHGSAEVAKVVCNTCGSRLMRSLSRNWRKREERDRNPWAKYTTQQQIKKG
mmetsp:Transcript_40974/g.49209  ORF Transcript_40974/g.49209 Transcript_40974/m.49209 type:complete len:266 (+) Transcript_40974:669-1466(+)